MLQLLIVILVFDKQEVNYTSIKLDPDYLKHYSSYVLIFTMNDYYLRQEKVAMVNCLVGVHWIWDWFFAQPRTRLDFGI